MTLPGRDRPASELCELLGTESHLASGHFQKTIRYLLRRSHGRNPFVREREDDLVQEVLAKAFQQARRIASGEVEPLRNVDAWLCRVTLNVVRKAWRDDRVARASVPWEPDPGSETPAPEHPAAEPLPLPKRLAIRQAIARLDSTCRQLLLRREVLGESRTVLGKWLGISANAIGVRLHRCRKRLLEIYESDPQSEGAL